MNLPQKISPCPIVEALVEIRFTPKIPFDAVFGVLYSLLKEYYSKVDSLPILQIPEALRLKDPNLIYKPTHKFVNKDFVLQLGPRVITLSNINEYAGWDIFSNKITELIDIITKADIIKTSHRLILRYIDFFKTNIYDNCTLQITFKGEPLDSISKNIVAQIQDGNYIHILMISDKTSIDVASKKLTGSIIDLSTQLVLDGIDFLKNHQDILNDTHLKQKTLFFGLLKEEFLATLNPTY